MHPYPYQTEALGAIRQVRQNGIRKALVIMASGLGKTVTVAFDLQQWLNEHPSARVLYLCHQNEILAQSQRTCSAVLGDDQNRYGFYHGYEKNRRAQILFGSFQTMRDRLHRFSPHEFDYIAIDESHHSMATTYRPIIEYFKPKFLLGMTATPNRMDLLNIRDIFGEEIVNIPLEDAMARGWLPPVEYHLVTDEGFDEEVFRRITQEVLQEGKRLSLSELNRRIFIRARDEKIAQIIEGYNEKTLVFCRNIHHAEHFSQFLNNAELYHSRQSRTKNQDVLENLRRGFSGRVIAVNAFNEGVDVPDVGLVVFLRVTQSETVFWQQLGRGLRLRPEKSKLIVLDFVGNIQRIQMLQNVIEKVARLGRNLPEAAECTPEKSVRERFHFSGKGFDFTFTDTLVNIMKVVSRVKTKFYATWEEASEAAHTLGIEAELSYNKRYREDPRLPSDPMVFYEDCPGWPWFFGRQPKNYYPTWQEASTAALALGIQSVSEYKRLYAKDPRLPSNPATKYGDFPGYLVFFGKPPEKDFYPTWEEAARVARTWGIQSFVEYKSRYKEDPCLPAKPHAVYKDFPGWRAFLEKPVPDYYPRWREAAKGARRLGIRTQAQYNKDYKKDPRLPSTPPVTTKTSLVG